LWPNVSNHLLVGFPVNVGTVDVGTGSNLSGFPTYRDLARRSSI